jgi:tetratricopeptide (TPR) repeat protein
MKLRRLLQALLATLMTVTAAAQSEQRSPREIWPQATSAARDGDVDTAAAQTEELMKTGKAYGVQSYPTYATAAASLTSQALREGRKDVADWASKAVPALDALSPSAAFIAADRAAEQNQWGSALPAAVRGFTYLIRRYRTSLLSRVDLVIVGALAIALTAIIFAVALFMRYGRSMAHDFREMLGQRIHGGSVSVLAFALLFLPVFIWLGPMWLVFYWFVIFFGYANKRERAAIVILSLLVAGLPILVEMSATWIALVDSPVVMSAISSSEQSYRPEALRRLQDIVAIVPDNPTLQVLLGNMHMFEGNEQQAAEHYRRAIQIDDSAGAHVNLGNLHFLQNDYSAAITEYGRAEKRDPQMAIAFYNDSVASGETYRFDQQGQKLEQAKKINQTFIEQLSQNPPAQKIAMYHPPVSDAWKVAAEVARKGTARTVFGNYAHFDPQAAAVNPVTIGAVAGLLLALIVWMKRRRAGYAGSCIKCGRTFCHRCKSARESATYCTQCIHIYLKRDGVALATKRAKLDEVSDHQAGMQRRNRLFATFLPGSAQILEGRTTIGIVGVFLFFAFVATAVFVGRLAPALGPVANTAQLAVRMLAIVFALLTWFFLSFPVYRRRAVA